MTIRYEIKCINKPDRNSAVDAITYVGGLKEDGTLWRKSTRQTIQEIEGKTAEFFVRVGSYDAGAFVITTKFGKHLRTEADETKKDNLLSLRECPS